MENDRDSAVQGVETRGANAWGEGAHWLGVPGRPLSAWQHPPTTSPMGAVVICPPLGSEHPSTARGLRNLAVSLSAQGMLVIRFDWSGVGGSAPLASPATAGWTEDVLAVVSRLVDAGFAKVSIIGLRLGGLLAAQALANAPESVRAHVDSLVLWDPVESGARFLRQQHALLRSALTHPPVRDQRAHGPGFTLAEPDAAALRSLRFDPASLAWVSRVAVIHRANDGAPPWSGSVSAEVWSSDEQEGFVDVPAVLAQSPTATIASLTQWISTRTQDAATGHPAPTGIPLLGPTECVLSTPSGLVREEHVVVGSARMPGVLSTPLEGRYRGSLLLLPSSTEPKSGPGGLWSAVAREQAATRGIATLRVDLPGVGEAGEVADRDPSPYRPALLDHVSDAARWLRTASGHLPAGAGICSGAYLLMQRAEDFAALLAINPLVYDNRIEDIPAAESALVNAREVVATMGDRTGSRNAVRYHLKRRLPHPLWRLTGRLGVGRTPDQLLGRSARASHLHIAVGGSDWDVFAVQRGPEAVRRVQRRGGSIEVSVHATLDHAVLSEPGRICTTDLVDKAVEKALTANAATHDQ